MNFYMYGMKEIIDEQRALMIDPNNFIGYYHIYTVCHNEGWHELPNGQWSNQDYFAQHTTLWVYKSVYVGFDE